MGFLGRGTIVGNYSCHPLYLENML
eukprot:SAG11_NODE_17437_length_518_cov_3.682578_1_plen_24_part_01